MNLCSNLKGPYYRKVYRPKDCAFTSCKFFT